MPGKSSRRRSFRSMKNTGGGVNVNELLVPPSTYSRTPGIGFGTRRPRKTFRSDGIPMTNIALESGTMRDLSAARPGSLRSSPFFSVVVTSSHGTARLAHTLRAVRDQSVRNRDVVVVDNSAEDVLPAVLDMLPEARLIRADRSLDLAALRNAGLAEGSGRYVAFLDSPDVWHPSYLHHHRTALQAMPDALFTVSGYMLEGPGKTAAVRQLIPEPMADNALLQMIMCPYVHSMSCFVAPRADLAAAKGFDARRGRYAAHDLCVRLLAGSRGRRELACLARPTPHIPHILTVRAIDEADLDVENTEWERQRDDFIAALFGRP